MLVTILKIVGIVLLCLLLFLIFLLLLILFAPIRYKVELSYKDGNLAVKAKVTWIAIIRFYLEFIEKKLSYKLNVLFISIINSRRVKKTVATDVADKTDVSVEKATDIITDVADETDVSVEKTTDIASDVVKDVATEDNTANIPQESEQQDSVAEDKDVAPEEEDKQENKKKFKFSIPHPADLYALIVEKLLEVRAKVYRKIKELKKNIKKICDIITSPENREFVIFVLGQLKKVLKCILPRKGKAYVKLGLSDPSLTGQILGAYSVINNVLGFNFILEPDFDNEVLEADVNIRGRIRVINLVIVAIRIYTNKTFRKFIRRK